MPADDLIRLVETLRAPYGLEKSVKIVPGDLRDDRCLISLHRNALGAAPIAKLTEMSRALGAPRSFEGMIDEALRGADIVHFGHEAGGGTVVRKLYFEYAERARRAMAKGDPVLVHLAYKWTPGRADAMAVTRYLWSPCRNRSEAAIKIAALLPAHSAARALRMTMDLLATVSALADAGNLSILEVEEPGNPRRSCDLNVYDAALRLSDIADLLATTARDFEVGKTRLDEVFGDAGRSALGHLSAGIDRNGGEFATIYYGIEARGRAGA